jgi:hypothetical protein
MKCLILSLTVLLATTTSFAQSDKYQAGMEKNLAILDSAKTSEEFTAVAASLERIAEAEKTQWLPYYYAALANISKGFADAKANKDDIASKAEQLIDKAEAIQPDNAELYVLRNMTATMRMLVDPQTRYMQYGSKMSEALATAKKIDAKNPRVYLLEGQGLFGTPPQFGGGKEKAKMLFEKALALYQVQKPPTAVHPKWGKSTAEAMLARCQ